MNRRTDHEELLADVLAEESQTGFGDALLGETLRLARRKRHWQQARRAGMVAALLLLAGFGVWQNLPRGKQTIAEVRPPVAPPPYQLIVSQSLMKTQLVTTQPMAAESLLVVEVTAPTIRTYDGGFREVGDDELLALAAPQTAALIRRGPHEVELVLIPLAEPSASHN
jgi:hypothetical protein